MVDLLLPARDLPANLVLVQFDHQLGFVFAQIGHALLRRGHGQQPSRPQIVVIGVGPIDDVGQNLPPLLGGERGGNRLNELQRLFRPDPVHVIDKGLLVRVGQSFNLAWREAGIKMQKFRQRA